MIVVPAHPSPSEGCYGMCKEEEPKGTYSAPTVFRMCP